MSSTSKLTSKQKKELRKQQLKEENEKIKLMNQKIKEPYLVIQTKIKYLNNILTLYNLIRLKIF